MHFPSVSLFSSVANAGVTDFFKQMGCEGSTNAYSIVGSTPLVDSLFSIKYALYEGKQDNPRLSLYAFQVTRTSMRIRGRCRSALSCRT